MKRRITSVVVALFVLLVAIPASAQEERAALHVFDNLIGGTWKGAGAWGDGSPFNQHIMFEWGLSGNLVKVKTYGNVGRDSVDFGLRNEGIRMWIQEQDVIKFWEFDIFGGVTEGTVESNNGDLYYKYSYDTGQGLTELTDAWIHQDDDNYQYIIGIYQNGEWAQKFLSATLTRDE